MNSDVVVHQSGMLTTVGIVAGAALLLLLVIGLLFAKLYKRASKEIGFVRTGAGGEKVVINGGALVLPVFHETMPVNMNTVRLAVERKNSDALITLDRLRIDVKAEFYVRVKPDAQSIAIAAQTLGMRTMHPDALKGAGRGQVRRCAPLGRGRHDHGAAPRAAFGVRAEGAAGFLRRPGDERAGAGERVAHRPRPDLDRALQREQRL
jgi:hypothetical protein